MRKWKSCPSGFPPVYIVSSSAVAAALPPLSLASWRPHVLPLMSHPVKHMPPPPDGGWGWVVVFASFMIHIVTDGVTYTFGLFLDELRKYFDAGAGPTAFIQSILVGVTLCSGPISSAFVNKYGCRPVTIAGALLGAFSLFVSSYATNIYTLYLTIGLGTGFGFGLIYLPAIVSVTCYFEKYRSLATGIAVCGSGLGTFVFAPVTRSLITHLGWRGALAVLSCFVLKCFIYGILFRPLESTDKAIPMEEIEPVKYSSKENNTLQIVVSGEEQKRPHSVHTFVSQKCVNGTVQVAQEEDVVKASLSQPMLLSQPVSGRVRQISESSSVRSAASGVMYRKDVLYRGSLHTIPPETRKASMPEEKSLMECPAPVGRPDDRVTVCGCFPCHPETRDTLHEMLDVSLLKDSIFILFTISNFLTSIGFYIPYSFLAAMAVDKDLSELESTHLLAIVGVANTVGRIVLGYLADKPWVNRLMVYNVSLTICGISTVLGAFCHNFLTFAIYASTFGFTVGAYVGLTSVILVDLLGLSRLTNAFGLLLLFQGVASFLGPPIAGWLYDVTQSYNPGFYVGGVTLALSGVMLFVVPAMQRHAKKQLGRSTS